MKKLILFIFILLQALTVKAYEKGDLDFQFGVGYAGNRGLVGLSFDKFLAEQHAVTVALGADFVGATSALGYRYFSADRNDKIGSCFFIFQCKSYLYGGISAQYAGATNLKVSTNGVREREYEIAPKWLGIVSIGSREVFKNNFTWDFELSYRSIVAGGKSTQTYGANRTDSATELGFRTVGLNVGIGYLF